MYLSHTKEQAFTLIELVICIVIMSVLAVGMGGAYFTLLSRTGDVSHQGIATLLAQGRMELILAQKRLNGFSSAADPCNTSTAPVCTPPSGYTVTASITNYFSIGSAGLTTGTPTNYKAITVTVAGPGNLGGATLKSAVAQY